MIESNSQNAISLSQQLLRAARYSEPVDALLNILQGYDRAALETELNTEAKKKVFWINSYNANVQIALKKDAAQYANYMKFFNKKSVVIAGEPLSPNDIEHGILRGGQWLYGLGYISSWFRSDFKKQFVCNTLDQRLHFALNCGAKSCPPILFYTLDNLDEELEMATLNFLKQTVKLNGRLIIVSKILSWYRGDFGGKKGIQNFLKNYEIVPESESDYAIKFADYNWKLELDKYADK